MTGEIIALIALGIVIYFVAELIIRYRRRKKEKAVPLPRVSSRSSLVTDASELTSGTFRATTSNSWMNNKPVRKSTLPYNTGAYTNEERRKRDIDTSSNSDQTGFIWTDNTDYSSPSSDDSPRHSHDYGGGSFGGAGAGSSYSDDSSDSGSSYDSGSSDSGYSND